MKLIKLTELSHGHTQKLTFSEHVPLVCADMPGQLQLMCVAP